MSGDDGSDIALGHCLRKEKGGGILLVPYFTTLELDAFDFFVVAVWFTVTTMIYHNFLASHPTCHSRSLANLNWEPQKSVANHTLAKKKK